VGVRLGFAVGKSEPELEYAAIEIAQPKEQFTNLSRFRKGCVQLILGLKALKGDAIEELQRPRRLVGD